MQKITPLPICAAATFEETYTLFCFIPIINLVIVSQLVLPMSKFTLISVRAITILHKFLTQLRLLFLIIFWQNFSKGLFVRCLGRTAFFAILIHRKPLNSSHSHHFQNIINRFLFSVSIYQQFLILKQSNNLQYFDSVYCLRKQDQKTFVDLLSNLFLFQKIKLRSVNYYFQIKILLLPKQIPKQIYYSYHLYLFLLLLEQKSMNQQFQTFRTLVQPYLRQFPEEIILRATLSKQLLVFRKEYIYFGNIFGDMRDDKYGISFEIANNDNLLIYEGSWCSDKYHGKGSLYMIEKAQSNPIYRCSQGNWKHGKLNGKAVIKEYLHEIQQWKIIYEGEFRDNYKHGYGIQFFNGSTYQGNFLDGCRSGHGRLVDCFNNIYDGEFVKGFPQGKSIQKKGAQVIVNDKNGKGIKFTISSQNMQIKQILSRISNNT